MYPTENIVYKTLWYSLLAGKMYMHKPFIEYFEENKFK